MAESESGQEKTEAATPRKREQAREEGQVPKSMDTNTAFMLVAGVVAFYLYGPSMYMNLKEYIRFYFEESATKVINDVSVFGIMMDVGLKVLYLVAPFFIIFFLTALAINYVQVGFLLSGKALQPKFNRINPIEGIKRLFSLRSVVELLKSMGKMFIIAPVMIYTIYSLLDTMPDVMNLEVLEILRYIGMNALDLAIRALIILIVLALIDFTYQRWQFEKDQRMTKEEVKQEMKDVQGDPQIKARIRSIQQEMSRKRMMQEVPEADVVVTNPTEYAIALKYVAGEMDAPRVIAKGRGAIAMKIREIALESSVPIVENRYLAQSLYKLVEVGGSIPAEMFQAVAEVLAYVYRLNNRSYQSA